MSTFNVAKLAPRTTLARVIPSKNGEKLEVLMTCRLDSDEEVRVYQADGVLQRFAMDFLVSNKAA